jgi:hypothetical protein
LDFFGRATLQPGAPRTTWIVIGVGASLLVATLLLPWQSVVQARTAVTAIGVVDLLGARLRPAAIWNAGSTRFWRDVFGDVLTVWLLTAIGIVIMVFAWTFKVGE